MLGGRFGAHRAWAGLEVANPPLCIAKLDVGGLWGVLGAAVAGVVQILLGFAQVVFEVLRG